LFLSEHEFGDGSVGFSVLGNEFHEFVVFGGESVGGEELNVRWGFVHEGGTGEGGGGSESSNSFVVWHL
jgi:hypothetical protein